MTEVLRQMAILSFLAQRSGASVSEIVGYLGDIGFHASEPTVKRDVAVLRNMNADIVSDRHLGYRLMNWSEIRGKVRRLRAIEDERLKLIDDGLLS